MPERCKTPAFRSLPHDQNTGQLKIFVLAYKQRSPCGDFVWALFCSPCEHGAALPRTGFELQSRLPKRWVFHVPLGRMGTTNLFLTESNKKNAIYLVANIHARPRALCLVSFWFVATRDSARWPVIRSLQSRPEPAASRACGRRASAALLYTRLRLVQGSGQRPADGQFSGTVFGS